MLGGQSCTIIVLGGHSSGKSYTGIELHFNSGVRSPDVVGAVFGPRPWEQHTTETRIGADTGLLKRAGDEALQRLRTAGPALSLSFSAIQVGMSIAPTKEKGERETEFDTSR
jgi:hypothetical protein